VGDGVEITLSDAAGQRAARRARWVRTFADARPSELIVLVDSYGMCTLALDRRAAATELNLRAGSAVTIAVEGAGGDTPVDPAVPVRLGRGEARR
jgi:S-adenosylmethionine hydrolase